MTPEHRRRIERIAGRPIVRLAPLAGGCIASAWRVDLADGTRLAAKTAGPEGRFDIEGYMLDYLRATGTVPVPAVLRADPDLLVMEYVETGGPLDVAAERHAAELLAALHGITGPAFGHERDTLIGPLTQPNPWMESWRDFLCEHRLLHMGRLAREAGRLQAATMRRIERLCARIDRYIDEPPAPALIHGDMWGGNVLVRGGRIVAFVDPAIYHADPEIELAFSTLFGTFGDAFFRRYDELRPLRPGFFEVRRDLYNLYPLLVHAHLFGGSYTGSVERIARRFA